MGMILKIEQKRPVASFDSSALFLALQTAVCDWSLYIEQNFTEDEIFFTSKAAGITFVE